MSIWVTCVEDHVIQVGGHTGVVDLVQLTCSSLPLHSTCQRVCTETGKVQNSTQKLSCSDIFSYREVHVGLAGV